MNSAKNRLMAVGLALAALLSSCQKELPSGRLELLAEGMGGGNTKMTVNGVYSYWQEGDKVNINGTEATITIGGTSVGRLGGEVATGAETAYVDGEFSADEYYIVFPSSVYSGRTGSVVTLDMPSTYSYSSGWISTGNGSGGYASGQVLNAPMAYIGDAANGRVTMKHLTGALNVQITGPSGIIIDRIIVGTTQNRKLSGEMQFDLSNLENIGSSTVDASASTITMIGGRVGTVQIPIPVLTGDVNFTVKVVAHKEGTKYTFERTQTTGGHLGRAVLGTVVVDLNEGQTGVTTSALFPTTVVGSKTYYQISTPEEFCLMSNAVCGTHYREDGDDYTRRWIYDGLYYKDANYILVNDIDMTGLAFTGIEGFCGELNGGNHTITNLTVSGNTDASYPVCWGLFASTSYSSTVLVENLQISNITLISRNGTNNPAYCGSLFGNVGGGVTISNVEITGYGIVRSTSYSGNYGNFYAGGFVGRQVGNLVIENSSVSFAANQAFTEWSNYMLYLGGITAYYQTTSAETSLDNVTVNFGTMTFVPWARRSFGGIGAVDYTDGKVTVDEVVLTGTLTFSSGNNTANKISPYIGSKDGVDASGLTIN